MIKGRTAFTWLKTPSIAPSVVAAKALPSHLFQSDPLQATSQDLASRRMPLRHFGTSAHFEGGRTRCYLSRWHSGSRLFGVRMQVNPVRSYTHTHTEGSVYKVHRLIKSSILINCFHTTVDQPSRPLPHGASPFLQEVLTPGKTSHSPHGQQRPPKNQ